MELNPKSEARRPKSERKPKSEIRMTNDEWELRYSGFGFLSDFGLRISDFRSYVVAMQRVRKLLHTRYRLNDLEKSVKFYKDVLGLEEVRRHKSPRGSELVFLKTPGSEELIELCHFPSSGPVQVQPDLTHLAFEVESLEEFGKHLAAHGIKYSDGPTMKDNGGGFAFIDAPEGYEIELIQPAKQAGAGAGY
jgi:lactoylglutathione lyase